MEEIQGQEFYPAEHEQDLWFFPTAMKVCNVQNNSKLAWKVDDFLNSGPHIVSVVVIKAVGSRDGRVLGR